MCANRVDELESRVRELEASVEGLTDELVECKVRIRELESAVDDETGFSDVNPLGNGSTESAESPDETEPTGETDAEAPKGEGTEEGDKAENAESSDIIVA